MEEINIYGGQISTPLGYYTLRRNILYNILGIFKNRMRKGLILLFGSTFCKYSYSNGTFEAPWEEDRFNEVISDQEWIKFRKTIFLRQTKKKTQI